VISEREPNLLSNIRSVYVYCDLLEHVPVGDTKALLLRIVDNSTELEGNVHRVFNPTLYVPLQKKTLERSPAKYPIRRVVCKSFTIPQNYLDVSHDKLFSGQLPTHIVIGLVDNRACNGDRQRNPFNFQHFNLNDIAVYLDGQQRETRTTRLRHGLYIRAHNSMFAGTGKLCKVEGLYISREDYSAGYALYAFDLTADLGE